MIYGRYEFITGRWSPWAKFPDRQSARLQLIGLNNNKMDTKMELLTEDEFNDRHPELAPKLKSDWESHENWLKRLRAKFEQTEREGCKPEFIMMENDE